MEGDNLVCNFKKCRKSLTTFAYVTACSHVFCDEDGTREFNKSQTCPACQTNLSSKFEIVRNNLQPSEQFKSMILAGLNPEAISEISARALSFWVYQQHQEMTYQGHTATKAKDRAQQLEQYYEQIVARTTTELSNLKSQLTGSKKELEETRKKYNEVSEKLMERNRQHQKLQSMYDTLRRKFITVNSAFDGSGDAGSHMSNNTARSIPNLAGANSMSDLFPMPSRNDDCVVTSPSRFEFNPRAANEPIHTIHFDQPANQVQKKFSVSLGTPRH